MAKKCTRHQCRCNQGDITQSSLQCSCNKSRGPVSQRHEAVRTQTIYDDFDKRDISVNVYTNDGYMAINKSEKERKHRFTCKQNDLWHGIKRTKKVMTNIASGPRYKEEKTWSEILIDKGEPVATLTHFYWAAMNWEGNSSTLRTLLVNIVYHYQNDHKRCHLALIRLSHISLEI